MKEVVTTVNKALALEKFKLEEMYMAGVNVLLAKEDEIKKLKKRLSEANHNMRRQIKRKNSKIDKYAVSINHLKFKSLKQEKIKTLQR